MARVPGRSAAAGGYRWRAALGSDRRVGLAIVIAAVLGGALRIAAARGELWGDEVWSLGLVGDLTAPDQVFWAVSHDNNHYLNSLWLYALGPGRPALDYRWPAILFGAAAVLAAGSLGRRRSAATGVASAVLAAICYPFVDYGSEARGYAGLILATLLALWAFETARTTRGEPTAPRGPWVLGFVALFGTASHFSFLLVLAVLGITAILCQRQAGEAWRVAVDQAVTLFRPTLLLLLPVLLAVAAGLIVKGGMTIGGVVPFSFAGFASGLGGLLRITAGVPAWLPCWLVLGGAVLLLALAAWRRWLPHGDIALGAAALLAVPGLLVVTRVANTEQPRYFLGLVTVLVMVAARGFGRAYERGGCRRAMACGLLFAALAGQGGPLVALLTRGRGQAAPLVAAMGPDPAPRYATNFEQPVALVLTREGRLQGRVPHLVSATAPAVFCPSPPAWYVQDSEPDDPPPPPRLQVGPAACAGVFTEVFDAPVAPLSGRHLTLYRRTTTP